MFGPITIDDGFRIQEMSAAPAIRPTLAKTIRNPRLVSGDRTFVVVAGGQSNIANNVNALYVPAIHQAKIDNFSFLDGGMYSAADPLIGASQFPIGTGGCWLVQFAEKLIAADFCDRVIIVPIAVGGTFISQWVPGAVLGDHYAVACRRLAAVGLMPSAFFWMQGEGDNYVETPQAVYEAALSSIIAKPRSEGFSAPWLIGKCTWFNGVASTPIRAAQAAVVNGTDIFAGADSDTLTGPAYRETALDLHWNASGAMACAELWKNAVLASGVAPFAG